MAVPAHKTEYFIIENSNLQKKANTPKNTANNLHIYLKENHLLDESAKCYPVFTNRNKNKLTRFGVMYILMPTE